MHNDLVDMINQGKYDDVLIELEKYDINEYTEELTIIAGSALMAVGKYEEAQEYLQLGLQINDQSDELYLLLGNYYERHNLNQAYLCYENAELYCQDMQDKEMIRTFKKRIEIENGGIYRKVSIIVLCSYSVDMVKRCIESIRKNSILCWYEIVAVCHTSMTESVEWLKEQEDVLLVRNDEKMGNSRGYNQGIETADPESDLLLLDSSLELLPNSLFWLKMALYEDEKIGAVGSQIHRQFELKNHVSIREYCEYKPYLDKLALLIRREAINEVGMLDVRFTQCSLWEKDFGLRLCLAGWRNVLCHNSYIYHPDSVKRQDDAESEEFKKKWSFDTSYDSDTADEIIDLIDADKDETIHVLHVGCGLGETLAKIQYKYPNSKVYGIEFELKKTVISNGFFNIVQGDLEELWIPFGNKRFDYIILSDILGYFQDLEKIIRKLLRRLKSRGAFLCSIPNFMNLSVVYSLMKGESKYEGTNILNKSYLNLNNMRKIFDNYKVYIDKFKYDSIDKKEIDEEFLNSINKILREESRQSFFAQRYIFRARTSVKEVKITAVGLIKNAADVIETYIRANGLLVDNFVLLDNMCSDRTIPILEQLRKEGFDIEIIKDEIIEHNQSEKMNRLIYYVNEKYHPDFIIPIDDDECVAPSSEEDTIEDIRYRISKLSRNNLYYLKWKIYVPTENDDESEICMAKRQIYCCEDKEEFLNKVIIPSSLLEDKTFSIEAGNHGGRGNMIDQHILLPFARMAHFPCRSEAQVRSKALTGWTNCLALPGRRPKDALQWKVMYSIAKKGYPLSMSEIQQMALIYAESPESESTEIKKEPINLPEEAMVIKYTRPDEVNPWENYCTNVEELAQKYAELLNKESNRRKM